MYQRVYDIIAYQYNFDKIMQYSQNITDSIYNKFYARIYNKFA